MKIKIHKTAICGTDVHIWQWNDWAQHTIPIGLTAGHEYVGEVVETGEAFADLTSVTWCPEKDISHVENAATVWKDTRKTAKMRKGVGVNRMVHLQNIL